MTKITGIPVTILALGILSMTGGGPATAGEQGAPKAAPKQQVMKEAKELGEAENGKTVSVVSGTKLAIHLRGNATTGYGWTVTSVTGKSLKQDGDVSYAADSTQLVGSGGTYSAYFGAVSPGSSTINMAYARSWEKGKPAAKKYAVTVDVTK